MPRILCEQRSRGHSDRGKRWGRSCLPRPSGAPLALPLFGALVISLALRLIRGLERRLLEVNFKGHNLTLQTSIIQTLVFKLSCDFAGLSLYSAALERVSQVRSD